ncbi:hypothetical protein [Streptomyces coeruleorubidus]|uniref:hypothetical protein n=1 Tax=Streptomyces coeruleorubidus TaxID=116188 RepID=UPI0033B69F4A
MNDQDRGGWKMLAGLLASSQLIPLEWLPAKTAEHAASAGFTGALIYLADLQREKLHLLTGQGLDAAREAGGEEAGIKIEGTLPGPGLPVRADTSRWPLGFRRTAVMGAVAQRHRAPGCTAPHHAGG